MSNGQQTMSTQPLASANGTVVNNPPELNDIDQVRDLLFGGHQREADRRFRATERRVEDTAAALQRLAERSERERVEAQTQVREHSTHMQARIAELQTGFQDRLREQRREFDQRFDELQARVTEMLDALDSNKLDQQDMAEILMDTAMRIKRAKQAPAAGS